MTGPEILVPFSSLVPRYFFGGRYSLGLLAAIIQSVIRFREFFVKRY
ncbi:MAG: hypothetical protein GXP08_01240 [Gammaproteobacteria bacterium]|nr:hypothetical protein [Gammaproteobacteria bacterium]